MGKGIIYVMTTVVPGLIKIGKTGASQYDSRMYQLERHGYTNVTGLKRHFAIEVDDYDEKEVLLQEIFSKSRLGSSELFALDVNLVVQLLSSFEGKQIYPKDTSKEDSFDEASDKRSVAAIPDGTYYLDRRVARWNNQHVRGEMTVKDNILTLKKGSIVCPIEGPGKDIAGLKKYDNVPIKDNKLQTDVVMSSPSAAASFLLNANTNGWINWKTKDNKTINAFRNSK